VDAVTPKYAYSIVQETWSSPCSCVRPEGTVPPKADFNAGTSNNYAGFSAGIYGGGNPAFQSDWRVAVSNGATGVSSSAGDRALRVTGDLAPGADYTYFGVIVTLFPDWALKKGLDLTGLGVLSFDVRLGSASAFAKWAVRLEDANGNEEFNNKRILLPTLTTSYQHVEIPLAQFTAGGGQVVDLREVCQIVFISEIPGGSQPSRYELNLLIDNLEIGPESVPAGLWQAY
jgi:hypothetical protein